MFLLANALAFRNPPSYVSVFEHVGLPLAIEAVRIDHGQEVKTKLFELKTRCEVSCSSSFDGRFLIVFSSPVAPLVMPAEGYMVADQRQSTWSQTTSLYEWSGNTYRLKKDFGHIGYSMEFGWNLQGTKFAFAVCGGMLTMDRSGPFRIVLLDPKNGKLSTLVSEETSLQWTDPKWSGDGKSIYARTGDGQIGKIALSDQQYVILGKKSDQPLTWKGEQSRVRFTTEKEWILHGATILQSQIAEVSMFGKGEWRQALVRMTDGKILASTKVSPTDDQLEQDKYCRQRLTATTRS